MITGRTHDPTYILYRLGERLSAGAKQYVETGRTDGLDTGEDFPVKTLHAFTGPPVPQGEGTSVARAFLDGNHTLISVMTRINPSPDWFVGVDSFQLCVEDNWVDTVTVEVISSFQFNDPKLLLHFLLLFPAKNYSEKEIFKLHFSFTFNLL